MAAAAGDRDVDAMFGLGDKTKCTPLATPESSRIKLGLQDGFFARHCCRISLYFILLCVSSFATVCGGTDFHTDMQPFWRSEYGDQSKSKNAVMERITEWLYQLAFCMHQLITSCVNSLHFVASNSYLLCNATCGGPCKPT